MNERPDTKQTTAGELEEREWTDAFGTHYEARIVCPDGRIVSQRVTKMPFSGWPIERQQAPANVRKAAS